MSKYRVQPDEDKEDYLGEKEEVVSRDHILSSGVTVITAEVSDEDEEEEYICDECGDEFESARALAGHSNKHS